MSLIRLVWMLSGLAWLGACGGSGSDGFVYADGTYTVSIAGWTGGDCDFSNVHMNDGGVVDAEVVFTVDGQSFTLSYPERGVLQCGMDGPLFDCSDLPELTTDYSGSGIDAEVTGWFSQEGEWLSGTSFSGSYTHTFTCEGEECDNLSTTPYGPNAAFPCVQQGEYEAWPATDGG